MPPLNREGRRSLSSTSISAQILAEVFPAFTGSTAAAGGRVLLRKEPLQVAERSQLRLSEGRAGAIRQLAHPVKRQLLSTLNEAIEKAPFGLPYVLVDRGFLQPDMSGEIFNAYSSWDIEIAEVEGRHDYLPLSFREGIHRRVFGETRIP